MFILIYDFVKRIDWKNYIWMLKMKIDELINWGNKWMNEMNEWMNEWMNVRIKEWMNEY